MFQVLHIRKIKTVVGLKNVAAHNSREDIYDSKGKLLEGVELPDWLNPDFSEDDFETKQITNKPEQASAVVLKNREKLIDGLKRKPQKNASAAVEFVISASPEFQGDWNAFFGKAEKFLRKKFGENCIQFAVHHDETTPHMHVLYVPIVEKNEVRKYSSSEFLGGIAGLKKLHTEFYEQVGVKFGLERGETNSRATHNEIKDVRELTKRLAKKEREFEQTKADWENQKTAEEAGISERKEELDSRENAVKTLSEALETRQKELDEKNIKLDEKDADLTAREAEIEPREKAVKDKETRFEKLDEVSAEIRKEVSSYDLPPRDAEVLPPLERHKVIATPEAVGKNFRHKFGEKPQDYAFRVVKQAYDWAVKKVQDFAQKYNRLQSALFNTRYSLAKEKDTSDSLRRELEMYDYRKQTPEKLEKVAQDKRRAQERKTLGITGKSEKENVPEMEL